MNSAILHVSDFVFDVKNIQESGFPSKTGSIRFLAVSALVASVFASALLPAVICTGIIAITTILKNRQIKQLKESDPVNKFSDPVNKFKDAIKNYNSKEINNLLLVCWSCLTEKLPNMPKKISMPEKSNKYKIFRNSSVSTEKYILGEIKESMKHADSDLVKKLDDNRVDVFGNKEQKELKELPAVSILSIIECLYEKSSNPTKAKEIRALIDQTKQDDSADLKLHS